VTSARRVLCVFPAYTPSFGTFAHAYPLMGGVKAFMPPQGLLLIAAYLPESWPVRFVDENIARATAEDFAWADVVFVSGMHVQAPQIHDIRERAQAAGKVAVLGRPVGVRLARMVRRLRLPASRRDGGRDGPPRRALDASVARPPEQIVLRTGERLPLPDFPIRPTSGCRSSATDRQPAILVRMPVPVRVLRHSGAVRAASRV
jgi:hypothetical protein